MPLRPLMPEEMDELSALPQPAAQPRISPLGPPPVDLPPPEMGTPPRPFTVGQTDLSTYQMPPVGSPFFRGEAARPGIPSSLRPLTPQEFDEMRNRVAPSSIRLQEPPSAPFGAEQAALLREEANRPPGVEGRPLDALARRPGWEDPATSTTSRIMDPLRTGAVGVRTAGIGIGLNARAATVDRINQILEGAPPVPGEMADGLRNMPPAALARLRDRLISEMGTGAQTSENLNQTLEAETIQAPLAVQQMMEAGKRGDNSGVLSAIWSDPGNVIAYLGLSSLPYSAATAAGGIVAGAPGAFAGSAMLEYGGSLMERLREHWGVDTRNRDAVVAALTNPVIARDVRWFGATRGTAIGALDAAAFGGTAAGFRGVANQAGRQSAMRTFGEGLRETGVGTVREGALGGAGEALAQVATGQPLDPGQIAAEALGETAGAVVSVPAAAARGVAQGFAERGGVIANPPAASAGEFSPTPAQGQTSPLPFAPEATTPAGEFSPPPAPPPAAAPPIAPPVPPPPQPSPAEVRQGQLEDLLNDPTPLADIQAQQEAAAAGERDAQQQAIEEAAASAGVPTVGEPTTITFADGATEQGQVVGISAGEDGQPVIRIRMADGLETEVPAGAVQFGPPVVGTGTAAEPVIADSPEAIQTAEAQTAGAPPPAGTTRVLLDKEGADKIREYLRKMENFEGSFRFRVETPNYGSGRFNKIRVFQFNKKTGLFDHVEDISINLENGTALDLSKKDDVGFAEGIFSTPPPTPAQQEAGNYQVGHIKLHGLDISIATAAGGRRIGFGSDGIVWSVHMPTAYGYIRRTTGADGDQLDVFLGPLAHDPEAPVFVIDQFDPETGRFDEHKVMMGFASPDEAQAAYDASFSDGSGPTRRVGIRAVQPKAFRSWAMKGDLKTPATMAGHHRQAQVEKAEAAAAEKARKEAEAKAEAEANTPVDVPAPASRPDDKVGGFTTAKGSTYVVHGDGSTTRNKAARPEHPGDSGPQERSDRTIYVTHDAANQLAPPQGGHWWLSISGNRAGLIIHNPKTNRVHQSAGGGVSFSDKPTIGAIPIEVWQRQRVPANPDLALYRVVHFGNPIVDLGEKARKEAEAKVVEAGKVGMMLAAGQVVTTTTGRKTTPFPRLDFSTSGKATNTIKRAEEWLMQNALDEARARGDDFNAQSFEQSLKRPSQSDKDSAEAYLFDPDFRFTPKPSILKPLSPPAPQPKSTPEQERQPDDREAAIDDAITKAMEAAIAKAREQQRQDAEAKPEPKPPSGPAGGGGGGRPAPKATGLEGKSDAQLAQGLLGILSNGLNQGPRKSLFNQDEYRAVLPTLIEYGRRFRQVVADTVAFTTEIVNQLAGAAIQAGGDVVANIQAMVERLRIYIRRFVADVQDGRVVLDAPTQEGGDDAQAPDGTVGTDEGTVPGTELPTVPAPAEADGETGQPPGSDQPRSDDAGGETGTGQPGPEPAEPGGEPAGPAVVEPRPGDAGGEGTGDAGSDKPTATDFVIGPDTAYLPEGGPVGRARANIAAIELAKKITAEKRPATPEEQAQLVKYVGWGGIPQIFDPRNKSTTWTALRDQLQGLLTKDQFADARASTLNAHYTSREVVTAMWSALGKMGFRGGKVLEPSVGTGNFIGMQPADMKANTSWVATELDPTTGMIAQLLYPNQKIMVRGFERFRPAPGSFDLVISNVPFGNFPVPTAEEELSQFQNPIHDYFLAKSIQMTRPGGVVAIVTSRYTMDKQDQRLRDWVAERADLMAAIRLPRTTFENNAGTSVTTDLLFFRKKVEDGAKEADAQGFKESRPYQTPTGTININQFFASNPDAMLGQMQAEGGQYARQEGTLESRPGSDVVRDLAAAIARFVPSDAFRQPVKKPVVADPLTPATPAAPETHGRIMLLSPEKAGDPAIVAVVGIDGKPLPWPNQKGKVASRMRAFVPVREALLNLLNAEESDQADESLAPLRAALNEAYDAFAKQHGPINLESISERPSRKPGGTPIQSIRRVNIDSLRVDPEVWKVAGIEIYDRKTAKAKKSLIFTERRIRPRQVVDRVDTAVEALGVSLSEKGKIDVPYMTRLSGLDEDTLLRDLGDAVFTDPKNGEYILGDLYLSGPVRKKLAEAKDAAEVDEKYQRNVAALEKVIPADLIASSNPLANEIQAPFGATWVPAKMIDDFLTRGITVAAVRDATRRPGPGRKVFKSLEFIRATGTWVVGNQDMSSTEFDRYTTRDVTLGKVVRNTLNQKTIVIRRTNPDGSTYIDQEATEEAQEAQNRLKRDWSEWVYQDDARREELQKIYNETQNDYVLPTFNTDILLKRGQVFEYLRPYQRGAVWRIILTGNTLLYHFPGAGKTFTMVAAAMEQRRMGLIRKPAFAVPNHMLDQFRNEFLILYPNARVLVTTNQDMQKKNRGGWMQRASLQDWDAIIMGHSTFDRIMPTNERMQRFIRDEMDRLDDAIRQASDDPPTVKEMEKSRKSLDKKLTKIEERLSKRSDDAVMWEQTGIDFLFLDEAHYYKKIPFNTQLTNVRNIPNDMSQRALGLMAKIEGMNEKHKGRSVALATGTAISNTMAEVWVMMRMLQPQLLKEKGWDTFDGWARNFGSVVAKLETNPTGQGFKVRERFQEFVNVPELAVAFRQAADIVTPEMVNIPRPKLSGGRAKIVAVKPTPLQQQITNDLADRAANLKRGSPDNMLSIVGEAKKAALDPRLLNDDADESDSDKLTAAADRILMHYWYGGQLPKEASDEPASVAEKEDVRQMALWTDLPSVEESGTIEVQQSNNQGDMLPVDNRQRILPLQTTSSLQIVFCDLGTPNNKRRRVGQRRADDPVVQDEDDVSDLFDDGQASDEDDISVQDEEEDKASEAAMAEAEAATNDTGFNVYSALKSMLVDRGIPEHEIAFIHDAKTPFQKEALFEKARSGAVRVLLGSTDKMGVGTNVQQNAIALHHLDAPWRPSDVEQRDARMVRNGNQNAEVFVYRYVTQETFDSYLWQTLTTKSNFIAQFLAGAKGKRIIEEQDIPLPDADTVLAIATGDPRVLKVVELRRRLDTLDNLRSLHAREQQTAASNIRWQTQRLERRRSEEDSLLAARERMGPIETAEQKRALVQIAGQPVADTQDAASSQFEEANKTLLRNVNIGFQTTRTEADCSVTVAGMPVKYLLITDSKMNREVQPALETPKGIVFLGNEIDLRNKALEEALPAGSLMNRSMSILNQIEEKITYARENVQIAESNIESLRRQSEAPFDLQGEHDKVSEELHRLETELTPTTPTPPGAPPPPGSRSLFRDAEDRAARGGTLKRSVAVTFARHVSRLTGGRVQFRGHDGRWVEGVEGAETAGLYAAGLISAALGWGKTTQARVVNHEVIHALKDLGLFTQEEWARLMDRARAWRADLGVDARYKDEGLTEDKLFEEGIAEAFARWMDDKPIEGAAEVKNLLTRISEFFKRLYRALVQDPSWGKGVEDIWEKVSSGEVGRREMSPEKAKDLAVSRLARELGIEAAQAAALWDDGEVDYQRVVDAIANPSKSLFPRMQKVIRYGRMTPEERSRIAVQKDPRDADINLLQAQLQRPKELFARDPATRKVWQAADRAITNLHTWTKRFMDEYGAAWKRIPKDARDEVSSLLFAGDREEMVWTEADLKDMGASAAAISGYQEMREMFAKLGRFIDQHRRAMVPYLRKRRDWLTKEIGKLARVSNSTAASLMSRRDLLVSRVKQGKIDPKDGKRQIDTIDTNLRALVDPADNDEFDRMLAELEMVQGQIANTSIRNRRTGYVPHRFFGSWQLYRVVEDDEENQNLELVAGPNGFFADRPAAIEAAKRALANDPEARFVIRPKISTSPASPGTELADASFWKMADALADQMGIEVREGAEILREEGIAKSTAKRRTATFLRKREGVEGYSEQFDKVMQAHIIESSRYVVMDRFKHTAESALEAGGLSRHKPDRFRQNMQRAVLAFMDDVYGHKQSAEAGLDRVLAKGSPLTAAAAMAIGSGAVLGFAGAAMPVAVLFGAFMGYGMYRARRDSADYATRGMMNYLDSVITHIKLGLVLNWISGVANSTQTAINCVDEETEALTKSGWKRHQDLRVGEDILTYDIKTDTCRWSPLMDVHRSSYNGQLFALESGQISARTTPGHRWAVTNKTSKRRFEVVNPLNLNVGGGRCGVGGKGHAILNGNHIIPLSRPTDNLPAESGYSDAFVALCGWIAAEGHFVRDGRKHRATYGAVRSIEISQSSVTNKEKLDDIRILLAAGGIKTTDSVDPRSGVVRMRMLAADSRRFLAVMPNKVPTAEFVASLPKSQIDLLIDAMIDGDGTRVPGTAQSKFFNTDSALMDAFQMACTLADRHCVTGQPKENGEFSTKPIQTARVSVGRFGKSATVYRAAHEPVYYDGIVWCPRVESGFWVARRNGKTYCTGNTYPVLGAKWTAEGMQAAAQAWWASDKPSSEHHRLWTVMQRAGVVSQLDYTEIPQENIHSRESWAETFKRGSLWMFRTAESANRATAFLGAYKKALDEGRSEAQSVRYARQVMDMTQHRYDAAYKPQLARQQLLRPALKFKNFVLQQTLFMLNLAKGNVPQTDGGLDGTKFPPAFWKMLTMVFLMGGTLGIPGVGVVDDVLRLIKDDYSPVLALKEWSMAAIRNNPDMAWALDAFVRGMPAIMGQDFSTRVGMGEKFIPTRLQDWTGPLWGTASRLANLGAHTGADKFAGLGDYLMALSTPLGRPFKAIEAEANGMPIWNAARPEWWAAARDNRFRWTNINKQGRAEVTEATLQRNPALWLQLFAGSAPLAMAKMYDHAELSRVATERSKKAGEDFRERLRMALTRAHFDTANPQYRAEAQRLLAEGFDRGYRPANPRAAIRNIENDINRERLDRSRASAPRAERERLDRARP